MEFVRKTFPYTSPESVLVWSVCSGLVLVKAAIFHTHKAKSPQQMLPFQAFRTSSASIAVGYSDSPTETTWNHLTFDVLAKLLLVDGDLSGDGEPKV